VAAAAVLLLGMLFVVGQPRRDTTPELGNRFDCAPGQPIESGAVHTCADLTACASASTWDASPPPIVATGVYATRVTLASGPVLGNSAGGYVVVFDLADGGQRRVQIHMPSMCRPATG
jgi:hypothetical protein